MQDSGMSTAKMYLRLNVQREVFSLWLFVILSNLAMINFGATAGYSAIALPILTNNTSSITLSETEVPLFASITFACQTVGYLLSLIPMAYGRRPSMISAGITSSVGWILIASSYTVTQLFIGRALTGVSMSLYPNAAIYLEEISTSSWKRLITITPNIFCAFGVLHVYFLGYLLQDDWKLIAAICAILSICFLICAIFIIPESPALLLTKGRKQAARIALLRIRGLRQETIEFQKELIEMTNHAERRNEISKQKCQSNASSIEEAKGKSSTNIQKTICSSEMWKRLVIVNLYLIFQQFNGLYVIIAYTVDFIVKIKITINPFLIAVIIGIILLAGTMITMFYSSKFGYRNISVISGTCMAISMAVLGVYMQFFVDTNIPTVPLVCIFVFVASGSIGFLPLPWIMIAELYPTQYISVLGPLTAFIATSLSCVFLQLYPMMVTQDTNVTIYFYCIVCVMSTIFLTIALPDARGETQVETTFRSNSQRSMVKDVYQRHEATDGIFCTNDLCKSTYEIVHDSVDGINVIYRN